MASLYDEYKRLQQQVKLRKPIYNSLGGELYKQYKQSEQQYNPQPQQEFPSYDEWYQDFKKKQSQYLQELNNKNQSSYRMESLQKPDVQLQTPTSQQSRGGLLGVLDRFLVPISKGATELIAPGNMETMAQRSPDNPIVKAAQVDRGLETDVLNTVGQTAAVLAGGKALGRTAVGRAATNTKVGKMVGKLGEKASNTLGNGTVGKAVKTASKVGGAFTAGEMIEGATQPNKQERSYFNTVGASMRSGVGDIAEMGAGASRWLGVESLGNQLDKSAKALREGFEIHYDKEFSWKNFLDPQFYSTTVARTLPFTLAMIPAGVGGWYAGATTAGRLGWGTFGKTILGSLGGVAATAPLEAAMEAGSVYDQAIRNGMTEVEANEAASQTFKGNMALLGITNATELALALSPLGKFKVNKVAEVTGRTAMGVGTEALQEGLQSKISADALGEEFSWTSPETIEAMAIGGLIGGGFTLAGSLSNEANPIETIANNVQQRLDGDARNQFDQAKEVFKQQGMSDQEATREALDAIAELPEVQTIIQEETEYTAKRLERDYEDFFKNMPFDLSNEVHHRELQDMVLEMEYTTEPEQQVTKARAYQYVLDTLNQAGKITQENYKALSDYLNGKIGQFSQLQEGQQTVPSPSIEESFSNVEQQTNKESISPVEERTTDVQQFALESHTTSATQKESPKQPRQGRISGKEAIIQGRLKARKQRTESKKVEDNNLKTVNANKDVNEMKKGELTGLLKHLIDKKETLEQLDNKGASDFVYERQLDAVKQDIDTVKNTIRNLNKPVTQENEESTQPLNRVKDIQKRMKALEYNASTVKEDFNWLVDNKEAVIQSIMDDMNNNPNVKRKHTKTKQQLAERTYNAIIDRLLFADGNGGYTVQYDVFNESKEDYKKKVLLAQRKKIESMTDESIEHHKQERKKKQDRIKKSIENPETIEEFEIKIRRDELTQEEQIKYEELKAIEQKNKTKQEKTQSKKVEPISDEVGFSIEQDKHSKTGADIWIVRLDKHVDKGVWKDINNKIRAMGVKAYYYGAKKGWVFPVDPEAYVQQLKGETSTNERQTEEQPKTSADKLRQLADNMQKTIDEKRAPRLTNTARRAAMAASAEMDADALERMQKIMYALADAMDKGELKHLEGISAKTHIETLDYVINIEKRKRVENKKLNHDEWQKEMSKPLTISETLEIEYPKKVVRRYDLERLLNKTKDINGIKKDSMALIGKLKRTKKDVHSIPFGTYDLERLETILKKASKIEDDDIKWSIQNIKDSLATIKRLEAMGITTVEQLRTAIREYIPFMQSSSLSTEEKQAREVKQLERDLIGVNIEGFFPTPKKIVEQMIDEADIQEGMSVLEPSAGKGDIAEELLKTNTDVKVIEISNTLRNILEKKGLDIVDYDFLEHGGKYDRIVMNPPFEKGMDIDHVRHAYDLLNDGGKVVAIMSEGPFFRSDKKSKEFREWLEEVGGTSEKLPEGAFAGADSFRKTGVNTRLVAIDKQPENNRDTFIIERVGQPKFVVKRGDRVLEMISKDNFKEVTVTSISHTKKEINGSPYGYFYPLDYKKDSKIIKGDIATAVTESGNEIEFEYAIVEADRLITSHDTDLKTNPDYPKELQPRDRSRAGSKEQVTRIAGKLNPRLLADSPKVSDGAPIIGEDMVVESGNGRSIAIKLAYEQGTDKANAYKEFVQNAGFGLNKEEIARLNNPVLVRIRKTDVDRVQFTREANESNVQAMSDTEQAVADAKKLTDAVMNLLVPSVDGNINTAENKPFISQFMALVVPKNERNAYMDEKGFLSKRGIDRVQYAIFAKAYGDARTIAYLAESTDTGIQNILKGLLHASPKMAELKQDIENKRIFDELDITEDLKQAIEKITSLRQENIPVQQFLDNKRNDLFAEAGLDVDKITPLALELMRIFEYRKRGYKGIMNLFTEYHELIYNVNSDVTDATTGGGLFNDGYAGPTKEEFIQIALERSEPKKGDSDDAQQTLHFSFDQTTSVGGNEKKSSRVRQKEETKGTQGKTSKADTYVNPIRNLRDKKEQKTINDMLEKGTITRSEILKYVSRYFKVPIGTGYYRNKALGLYKKIVNSIRMKNFGDFVVLTHELGHRLDQKYKLSDDSMYHDELYSLAKGNLQIPKEMPREQIIREGVAEFMRLLVYNPSEVIQKTPDFYQYFEQTMRDNDMWEHVENYRKMIATWIGQSASDRVRGVIDTRKKRKNTDFKNLYRKLFDDLTGIQKAVNRLSTEKLRASENPFLLAWKTRGASGKIQTFLEHGVVDKEGNKIAPSFKEILESVSDLDVFREYLTAKHALTLHEEGKWKTPISVEDANEIINNAPQEYVDAAEHLYEYQSHITNILEESGLLAKGMREQWEETYPFYVPFYRVMEESGERDATKGRGFQGKKFANQSQAIKKMKEQGSARNIIDPLESIIKNTFMYLNMAERNDVGVALSNMLEKHPESAEIMEEVDQKMMMHRFDLGEVEKDILNILQQAGVDLPDNIDIEGTSQIFRPMFMPSAKDNILVVWKNGNRHFYQVRDQELYNGLLALDQEQVKWWAKWFGYPNQVLRAGITLSPTFIPRTFIRSVPTLMMQSDSYTTSKDFMQLPFDMMKAFMSVIKKDDAYVKWLSSGGAQSTILSIERDYLLESKNRLFMSKDAKEIIKREAKTLGLGAMYKSLRYVAEKLDETIRLTEFNKALEKTGDMVEAAVRSRDIDVDFGRFGTDTKNFNRLTLFFNVSLQGPDKTHRTIKQHPLRSFIRGSLFLTMPTLALMALNYDDKDYWELEQWERDLFWNIPMGNGRFVKIPIPFEWGLIFKVLPERILTEFIREDRKSFGELGKTLEQTILPSVLPTLFIVPTELITNTSLSTGRDIVNMGLRQKENYLQYDSFTSEFAKWVGEQTNISPKKIDHAIKGTTGTLGTISLEGIDKLLFAGNKGDKPKGDRGIVSRAFTADSADGNTHSTQSFYKELEKLEKEYSKEKAQGIRQDGEVPPKLKMMRKAATDLTKMRKIRDEVRTHKELTAQQKGTIINSINLAITDVARVMTGNEIRDVENLNNVLNFVQQVE